MAVKLEDRMVATLKPKAKRQVLADAVVTGLRLRITPGGAKTWGLWYRTRAGEPRDLTLGSYPTLSLAAARELARRRLAEVALGADPHRELLRAREEVKSGHGALTVEALVERCMERLRLRPSTAKVWRRLADVEIIPALGSRPAAEVTRGELRQWLHDIVERPAPAVANHAFTVLRRAYTWGIEQDLLTTLPFLGLKKPAAEVRSERVLSAPEIAAVLQALDELDEQRPAPEREERAKNARRSGPGWPAYADAVRLLLLTGVRRDMVLGMRRSELEDLDGPDPRWVIPGGFGGRSKSGRQHVVPLSAPAVAIVKRRLAAATGELLFPVRRRGKLTRLLASTPDVPMTWSSRFVGELCEEAEKALGGPMPRWTIHNLRHTTATHMREDLRVDRTVVAAVLGHVQAGPFATRIYDRSELLLERRAALVAWAAWLDGLRRPAGTRGRVVPMAR